MTAKRLALCFTLLVNFAQGLEIRGLDLVKNQNVQIDTSRQNTVIIFLSTRCPCSRSYEPILRELATSYTDFAWVGVVANAGETENDIRAHFQTKRWPFPVVQSTKLADELKASRTPHAFVLTSANGQVFAGGVGPTHNPKPATPLGELYLTRALDSVRRGEPVAQPRARALGCPIR